MTTSEQVLTEIPCTQGVLLLGVLQQVRKDAIGFFLRAGTEHPEMVRVDLEPARFC